uniref:Uncharacterized protein n=1 Tax=Lotus japonicus TaxID=34305 RepID=I3SGP4_LOTJA|nr:unknown [Lotus japonicus]
MNLPRKAAKCRFIERGNRKTQKPWLRLERIIV